MTFSFSMALLYSLLGVCIVFFALVLLMCIIKLMTFIGDKAGAKKKAAAPAPAAPTPAAAPAKPEGKRFGGEIKLYDTDPRDAAMCMAIVADTTGIPLNELIFLSVKEIKE